MGYGRISCPFCAYIGKTSCQVVRHCQMMHNVGFDDNYGGQKVTPYVET